MRRSSSPLINYQLDRAPSRAAGELASERACFLRPGRASPASWPRSLISAARPQRAARTGLLGSVCGPTGRVASGPQPPAATHSHSHSLSLASQPPKEPWPSPTGSDGPPATRCEPAPSGLLPRDAQEHTQAHTGAQTGAPQLPAGRRTDWGRQPKWAGGLLTH